MTDRPILFSAPMIRALLDGRKTQTRRVLNPQPDERCVSHQLVGTEKATGIPLYEARCYDGKPFNAYPYPKHCLSPYPRLNYSPGDRLWVKETHAIVGHVDPGWILYRASGFEAECERHSFDNHPPESDVKWKPSIFMPRWASRITLIVTDVRVERIQDISEADSRAEGVERSDCRGAACHKSQFHALWDSLNAKRGFGWEANPWVVAIAFSVQARNIDQLERE
ncbi:hypothetical protein [Hyphobacterium sp.]|uniref:hypothetical protein n=1 Tax=Hyphobacterium sp. TaxID=2004662 RepID=UPI003B526EB6